MISLSSPQPRLTALAGLAGAAAMFAGDMLFYGQWGSGEAARAESLHLVATAAPSRLMLGGLLSVLAGLGYLAGAVHVLQRLKVGRLLAGVTIGLLVAVLVVSIATHAVWGAFALAVASGSEPARVMVGRYLDLYFLIGESLALPVSLLLLGLTITGRTLWPRWVGLFNPGLIYLVLSTATWWPAPLGAAVVGGAFNLAFGVFFLVSLATVRP
jgi:cytochrome c oxidase subunit IV